MPGKAPGLPPKLKKGPAGIVNWGNALIDFVKSLQIKAGVDYEPDRGPDGTELVKLGQTPPGAAAVLNDFSLYDASASGTLKIGIRNGTVASQLPTGMTMGGQPPYTQNAADAGYAYLIITTDSTQDPIVQSVSIDTGDSVPDDAPDPGDGSGGTYYLSLGEFAPNTGNTALNIGSGKQGIGSQVVQMCGTQLLWGPA